MTTTQVIGIEIDPEGKFKDFYKLFEKYSEKVEEMPAEWQALNDAMGGAGSALAKGAISAQNALALAAASTTAIVEAIALAAKEQDGFTRFTKAGTTAMAALGGKVKDVVSGVLELGKTMFKFGGLGGTLVGVGGAAGIADLAGSVLSAQRYASGLGLSVGQQRAFSTSMGRYVGDNVLSGAASAQVDPTKYGYLAALGINPQQAANEDAATLAAQEINAVRAAWRANPSLNTAQAQAALNLGFNLSDIRNVASADPSSLSRDEKNALNPAGLGFSKSTADSWIQLSQVIQKAEYTVQTALIDGLQPLTPILTRLSTAGADAISALLSSKTLKADLTDFAGWLESPKFKQDVTDFISGFDQLAGRIKSWLSAFGLTPSNQINQPGGGSKTPGMVKYDPNDPEDNWPPGMRQFFNMPPIDPTTIPGYRPPAPPAGSATPTSYSAVMRDFMSAGYSKNFAAAMASNAYSESSFKPWAKNVDPKTGAVHAGLFQWDATRRAQIMAGTPGHIDVWKDFSPDDQVQAAIWELQNTQKGVAAKIAAIADGPGLFYGMARSTAAGIATDNLYEASGDSLAQQIARGARAYVFAGGYGIDPSAPAPQSPAKDHAADISATLRRIARQGNKPSQVSLNISNSTAARVSVSANAARY